MRNLVVMLLAGLLLACPLVCGEDEIGHGARHDVNAAGDAGGDHTPDQCPEGGDNCVCRGAVRANDVRADVFDTNPAGPLALVSPSSRPILPAHRLTLDGSPTGLASWGQSLTVRAYLQNFRF